MTEQDYPAGDSPPTSATILDTIGPGTMPCHPHEQTAVVTEIGRPIVLAVGLASERRRGHPSQYTLCWLFQYASRCAFLPTINALISAFNPS